MTTAKIDSKTTTQVAEVVDPYLDTIAAKLRSGTVQRLPVVGELVPTELTEPAPGEEKAPSVKLRLATAEIPDGDEQTEQVREVQRAFWLLRTSAGTLTPEGDIELAKHTANVAGDRVAMIGAARYRAALGHWATVARTATTANLSASEMWIEMERLADGLAAALGHDQDDED
ncbi:hypothetical protein F4561_006586 [Lipingzhangella halophila]|uniref:Tail assembly chaperone n=1 Tax=Lipingzhangella halophila TaxID=1783352 RepID=A0A7W7RPT6_9ACTN|nr:hypothetical protein [Lipingzhangella halophila]MBB4935677.1 hypothetical protein [Lipingzhangella halophila]